MAEQTPRLRQVARKLWIREILDGDFEVRGKDEPSTLVTARTEAGRVNVIGVVIGAEELPVPTLVVDDGTGQLTMRSFDLPLRLAVGTVTQIIGRPRTYQGAVYVAIEAAKPVEAGWAEYRKRELGAVRERAQAKQTVAAPVRKDENNAELIIRLVKQLDDGEGADIDAIIDASKLPNAEDIIDQLLLHGDLFELRPGKVKVL